MEYICQKVVDAAAHVLGEREHIDDDMIRRIEALVIEPLSISRLINVIPEAFAMVLISHMPTAKGVVLPRTFHARNRMRGWTEFLLEAEPIFGSAILVAQHIYQNGPRQIFQNNANRSALVSSISNALHVEGSLEGATIAALAFEELPASLYRQAGRKH